MNVKATLRVRTPDEQMLPDRVQMERAAALLRQSGFDVLRIGRAGINVEADADVFQRELGVDLRGGTQVVATPSPRGEEMSELIDSLEIAGKPLSF